jgi:hypothetical protein
VANPSCADLGQDMPQVRGHDGYADRHDDRGACHEYLTNLMDSDTMLTLEITNDAIKRAENYMQRQDTDGDKRVAFSSAVDDT